MVGGLNSAQKACAQIHSWSAWQAAEASILLLCPALHKLQQAQSQISVTSSNSQEFSAELFQIAMVPLYAQQDMQADSVTWSGLLLPSH
jgi:hypothetical protein